MNDQYDKTRESVYIKYVDANNEYGWSMSKYLLYGGFKWASTNIDTLNVPHDSPKGYILEVDLEYSKELHDYHSDFPLAPENENLPKLMTTLYNKEKDVIHNTTLKLYLKLGLKLEKNSRSFRIRPFRLVENIHRLQ
jgi:hypothetical protein